MDHFTYQRGVLHGEQVPITDITKAVGTPFYCYSQATLTRHYRVFKEALQNADSLVCFAVKANSNQAVLSVLAKEGAGADVVSEGEIRRALAAGIPAEKIVFSGVGKTRAELAYALEAGIYQFNIESEPELLALDAIAQSQGRVAPIAIRVNPDVDGQTHGKITTGRKEDKFGIAYDQALELYAKAAELEGIAVKGISTHIGSQITDTKPFHRAFDRTRELVLALRREGHHIERLDLGGGLGIPYAQGGDAPPAPSDYAQVVLDATASLECQLIFEPGRLIAGNAGILVSSVIAVKQTPARNFLIIDAGMNDLVRPSMYDAHHDIIPVTVKDPAGEPIEMDVVGPVCETGDIFAKGRLLHPLTEGDLVAFRSAGAYGATMSNTYNSRLLVPEVLVHEDNYAAVRPRPSYDAMLGMDIVPEWV